MPCWPVHIVAKDVDGTPITDFKWQVNLDNSHDNTDILWPIASYSPVVATGHYVDGNSDDYVILPASANLFGATNPENRGYLVTVLANDGVGSVNNPD